MDLNYLFTSLEGRINRAKWWAGIVILGIINIVLSVIVGVLFGPGLFAGLLVTIIVTVLFLPTYAVCAKRFQDRDKPGKMALYGLIPTLAASLFDAWGLTMASPDQMNGLGWLCVLVNLGVGLWFLIDLGILKGSPGSNQYGGDPLAALD